MKYLSHGFVSEVILSSHNYRNHLMLYNVSQLQYLLSDTAGGAGSVE